MNNWTTSGRLTKDPEKRMTTNGTAVTSFTLAVDRNSKDKKTDFINCVAMGKLAEICASYLTKGKLIEATARMQSRTWDGQDGKKHYALEAFLSSMRMLDKKPESTGETELTEVDDSDLPF